MDWERLRGILKSSQNVKWNPAKMQNSILVSSNFIKNIVSFGTFKDFFRN